MPCVHRSVLQLPPHRLASVKPRPREPDRAPSCSHRGRPALGPTLPPQTLHLPGRIPRIAFGTNCTLSQGRFLFRKQPQRFPERSTRMRRTPRVPSRLSVQAPSRQHLTNSASILGFRTALHLEMTGTTVPITAGRAADQLQNDNPAGAGPTHARPRETPNTLGCHFNCQVVNRHSDDTGSTRYSEQSAPIDTRKCPPCS